MHKPRAIQREKPLSKQKGTLRKTISITKADYEYAQEGIDSGRFDSLSHVFRAGVIQLRKEQEVRELIIDQRRVIDELKRRLELKT